MPQRDSHGAAGKARPGRGELVGILGGMGPAATADFYQKLIRRTKAEKDQDHLRVVIWADPTVPDRVPGILGNGADPYPAMRAGAQHLRDLGSTVVAMPCNSAHYYLGRLVEDTGLNFISMIDETARHVHELGVIGLMGTRALVASGLYQDRLAAAGTQTVTPSEEEQQQVDLAIRLVKQGDAEQAHAPTATVATSLLRHGARAVLLACTELPLAVGANRPAGEPRLVDPTDLLAEAVVRECRPSTSSA